MFPNEAEPSWQIPGNKNGGRLSHKHLFHKYWWNMGVSAGLMRLKLEEMKENHFEYKAQQRNIDRTLFCKVFQTNAHGRHRKIQLASKPALKWPCKRITMHKYIIYNPYSRPSLMSNSWQPILHTFYRGLKIMRYDNVCTQTHMYGSWI